MVSMDEFESELLSHASSTIDDDDDDVKARKIKEKQEEIAKAESKAIVCWRLAVLTVLILSALLISLGVYSYTTGVEKDEFTKQYNSDAMRVLESIGRTLANTFGAMDAFSVNMVTYARSTNARWPFVTIPNFALQALKVLRLAKAFQISVSHFVPAALRTSWEKYASQNDDWVEEALNIQEQYKDFYGPIQREYNVSHEIKGFYGPVERVTPYRNNFAVRWQGAPVVPASSISDPYNFDVWQIPRVAESYLSALETQSVMLGSFANVYNQSDPVETYIYHEGVKWASNYIRPGEDPSEPALWAYYPVLDDLSSVRIDSSSSGKGTPSAVAMIQFVAFFREFMRKILPTGSNGIILVFSQGDCGDSFTYELYGPEPTFLGLGDLHDPAYNHMEHRTTIRDLMDPSNFGQDNAYTGLPISDSRCPKTIRVYPSPTMEDVFRTARPLYFTLVTAGIFFFTSTVFLTYDMLVARRQRIVMDQAVTAGAIVSSLFPDSVKHQLFEEKQAEWVQSTNLTKFMISDHGNNDGNADTGGGRTTTTKPIANQYEETTIMLADLKGFTAWSSTRTPTEVFELLEALYGAFDAIAVKRQVFKVETIGDCYVAVTGIPLPQNDHATRMVRFAHDCMREMKNITANLGDTLGTDTVNLDFRVGLHSGPTTAGVIRGEKARFQLFGDTINTASRMESNGVPGRIHVSQATADALISMGKQHWLSPREDKIVAKGKGEMQTYFVTVTNTNNSIASTSVSK